MNKKNTVAIAIIVVILALAAYFALHMPPSSSSSSPASSATATSSISVATSTSQGVQYVNDQYGFSVSLPQDWQGYTIATTTWIGHVICPGATCPTETGPEISIRNPQWTAQNAWQPIPILIFTPSQWSEVASETLAVSAAPIPPSKLGQNSNYVFALPARYNYAYPEGWQEVQAIMQSDPLKAF